MVRKNKEHLIFECPPGRSDNPEHNNKQQQYQALLSRPLPDVTFASLIESRRYIDASQEIEHLRGKELLYVYPADYAASAKKVIQDRVQHVINTTGTLPAHISAKKLVKQVEAALKKPATLVNVTVGNFDQGLRAYLSLSQKEAQKLKPAQLRDILLSGISPAQSIGVPKESTLKRAMDHILTHGIRIDEKTLRIPAKTLEVTAREQKASLFLAEYLLKQAVKETGVKLLANDRKQAISEIQHVIADCLKDDRQFLYHVGELSQKVAIGLKVATKGRSVKNLIGYKSLSAGILESAVRSSMKQDEQSPTLPPLARRTTTTEESVVAEPTVAKAEEPVVIVDDVLADIEALSSELGKKSRTPTPQHTLRGAFSKEIEELDAFLQSSASQYPHLDQNLFSAPNSPEIALKRKATDVNKRVKFSEQQVKELQELPLERLDSMELIASPRQSPRPKASTLWNSPAENTATSIVVELPPPSEKKHRREGSLSNIADFLEKEGAVEVATKAAEAVSNKSRLEQIMEKLEKAKEADSKKADSFKQTTLLKERRFDVKSIIQQWNQPAEKAQSVSNRQEVVRHVEVSI